MIMSACVKKATSVGAVRTSLTTVSLDLVRTVVHVLMLSTTTSAPVQRNLMYVSPKQTLSHTK